MALFSFVVAPAVFAVLPSQQLAGNVVNHVLGATELVGMVLGVALLFLLLVAKERRGKLFRFELIMLALMTLAMAVSKFVVSARLHTLCEQFGERLQTLAAADPVKVAFDQLHQYSVWLMSFDLLAALILIVLLIRYPRDADA
jgi:hypothetical protein